MSDKNGPARLANEERASCPAALAAADHEGFVQSGRAIRLGEKRCSNDGLGVSTLMVPKFAVSGVWDECQTWKWSKRFDEKTIQFLLNPSRSSGSARVYTMYKSAAKKVRPVNYGGEMDTSREGVKNWKAAVMPNEVCTEIGRYDQWITPKFSDIERGKRLTPERIEKLSVGGDMTPAELDLLHELLFAREKAIAFEYSEMGSVREEVAPPQKIRTIEHQAWQVPGFPVPKALYPKAIEIFRSRIAAGVMEESHSPYRNPWFLVPKSTPGEYRFINHAVHYNKVTIRDANLPPTVDEFSEAFAGCVMSSLIDFFSGYDQLPLDKASRAMTAFMTPLGLLQYTKVPQGATNSVAQFVRVINRIIGEHVPEKGEAFLDDCGIKGPITTYNNEEVAPGIRRFVLEHIQNLDAILSDIERAGCTIGPKSQFCVSGMKIVGFICDADGRKPESAKVIKILEWPPCRDVGEARSFIGICVYYRLWIKDFATVAAPIYALFRKKVAFKWGTNEQDAMDRLKVALTTTPALIRIDYGEGAGDIILTVDASLQGWGAVLQQEDDKKKRHPNRYESGMWDDAERNYDATKRECRGVLKALKKLRYHLYGKHFILETDAKVLVAQLNRSGGDVPGALIVRWLAWIRLFDFDVRHIPGKKNTAADGLSRRPRTESDDIDEMNEVDIDEWIAMEFEDAIVMPIEADGQRGDVLLGFYTDEHKAYAQFLATLKKPESVAKEDYRSFKKRALRFLIREQTLFRRATNVKPELRVVDDPAERQRCLESVHDQYGGHRGFEALHANLSSRYYWDGMYQDCKTFYKSCPECQFRATLRSYDPLHPTFGQYVWDKVVLDVVHMPPSKGKNYMVVMRDEFGGWPEARALRDITSESIARFIYEDGICRHGVFRAIVMDGGPENQKKATEIIEWFGAKRIYISAYHPQANGAIEVGHKVIKDALSKITKGGKEPWVPHLPTALLADRSTVRPSTGCTPFYLHRGSEAVLPIELDIPTWRVLDWHSVKTTAELLAMRMQQIERRDELLQESAARLRRHRMRAKDWADDARRTRKKLIQLGQLVLLWDSPHEKDMSVSRKLNYRWLGPYRIKEVAHDKGTYMLEEFDGTTLKGTFAGNRVKAFIKRAGGYVTDDESGDSEDVGSYLARPINSEDGQGAPTLQGGDENAAEDDSAEYASRRNIDIVNEDTSDPETDSEDQDDVVKARTTRNAARLTDLRKHIPKDRPFAVVLSQKGG